MIVSVVNQKGGVGKTTTCIHLGAALAKMGKKTLLIDADPQGSLTAGLGFEPDELSWSIADILGCVINETEFDLERGVLTHDEGFYLIPANIELSGLEMTLVNVMGRESVLKEYVSKLRDKYDYIIIDSNPSLGMLTVNALAAADSIIIPLQAQFLPVKGLEQLLVTVKKARKQINPNLKISGVLLTMVDNRVNFSKDIIELIQDVYGENLRVFPHNIPASIRVSEASAKGKSVFAYDGKNKVAAAYMALAEEIING